MSFVLQLGSVEGSEEPENGEIAALSLREHVPTSEPMNIVVQLTPSEPREEREEDQAAVTTSCSKPTIVYPGNQARIQAQNLQSSGASSPGVVVAAIAKPATIVYPVTKFASDLQKDSLSPTSVSLESPTRVIQQATGSPAPQQSQVQQKILQIITSAPTSNSQQQLSKSVNNLVNSSQPGKIQITYDAQTAKLQQSTSVFQSSPMVHKFITAANVKTITPAIQNIQRLQTKSTTGCVQSPVTNIPKVKTITSVGNQGVAKNMVAARVQAVPTKPTPTVVHQQPPPVPTNQHGQRIQQNPQKTVSNQKQNPTAVNAKNNANHKSNSTQQQSFEAAVQAMQKIANLPAKVQRQAATPQQQKPQFFQVAAPNNIQKTATAGVKPLVAGQAPPPVSQSTNNVQQIKPQGLALMQKCQTTVVVNPARTNQPIMNINKSASVPNVAKVPPNSSVTINKTQYISQTPANLQHTLQLQQIISQTAVQQSQSPTPKQQTVSLQAQRAPANTNIQPKINVVQQNAALASMPVNQKSSVVLNTKGQPQQTQMLLRLGLAKNSPPPGQLGGVKGAAKNPMTPIKTAGPPSAPSAHQNRPVNAQPIKIIQQQSQNVLPSAQTVQKQPGCIKTIPPQKPHQRNNTPAKPASCIKTSLNTNMSCMKSQPVNSTSPQKTSIKTLLPQQPNASSQMMAHKNQGLKGMPPQSIPQKQLLTAQYPQQVVRPHGGGHIKTMLPIISPEMHHREIEANNEADIIAKGDETQEFAGRRMPHPYECLQFVLQDHNYGAPPPRTPSPKSSPPHPIKQQSLNGAGGSAIQHPFIYNQTVNSSNAADDAASAISSEAGREAEPEGEETETAPEGEGDDEDSITRCICEFEHDDGYMICCDRCVVWQHVDCMGIDRSNIPDEYLCERCRPRRVDRQRARTLQMRKREELMNSDTSSDTSSTSSADTDVGGGGGGGVGSGGGGNAPVKKRLVSQQPQQQQQLPVPRRKADPPPSQLRKLNNNNTNSNNNNNNNNNNVAKRQRREQHPRQASANRKKETVKRGPGKRKVKRRMSVDGDEDMQDAWGSNMAPLRQWIEKYEEAVTNHYSPELRARISSIKVNGTHSDLRQSNISNVANGKCRLNVHSNSLRFLVATMYLPPNTPVVELRGKYMLSTQHRPSHPQGRQHTQRPGPFVFFYRLPREGTEVCVDTRTYGNDARFVRRSCKPNAEVKHCIEKGMLHLYIVTTTAIEKNTEITIRHEQHDLMLSPNSNSSVVPVPCACGNARLCQMAAAGQLNLRRGSNGALAENADGRERRRRGRRNTASEDVDSASPTVINSSTPATATVTTQSTPSSTITAASTVSPGVKKIVTNPTPSAPAATPPVSASTTTTRVSVREESQAPSASQLAQELPVIAHTSTTPQESKKDKKKMTREERKMEAIMKAFERMEKAEQRKQEVQARNAQRKESGGTHSDNDEPPLSQPTRPKQAHLERPMRRKRRKGRARTISSSHSQNSRRTRLNSADSDLSSCEENMMIQSPPASSQICGPSRDNQFSPRLHTPTKEQDGISYGRDSHNQVIPTAADLLLALANSNMPGPSSPPLQQPPPSKSPTCDSGASSSSQSSTPSTPLSSACLLVAAAVGPLAPGFKFPKTKKVMMNEWLRESPDPPPQSHVPIPHVSPNTAIPMVSSPSHQLPSCRQADFLSPSDPSPEFLTQSYAAKGLATLVQAANSVAGICDSPPQRKHAAAPHTATAPVVSAPSGNNAGVVASSGSAKKRWLRQAISEECDSPNSRPESPPSEMVAPPKKRRFARESISSDNYTPPTTPTHVVPDLGPLNAALGTTEADYVEQQHSPLSLEGQIKMECESEPLKDDTNSESEKPDFYKIKAATKIPDDVLPAKPEDTSEIDNKSFGIKVEDDCTLADSKFHVKDEQDIDEKNSMTRSLIEYKTELTIGDEKSEVMDHQSSHSIDIKAEIDSLDEKPSSMDTESAPETPAIADLSISAPASQTESEQNIADMPLELSSSAADLNSIDNDENLEEEKEVKAEDTMSIDEFDVEAQMKKITGDDGNDYKEKEDTLSDRDKSMDGIEGLMDSSKEDSDSEDRDFDDLKFNEEPRRFKDIEQNMEERAFKELETLSNNEEFSREISDPSIKSSDPTQPEGSIISSEESMFDSIPSNIDCESVMEPPKIFQSIPPLSERIRKKTDISTAPKKALDFEAAIIESTLDMESIEVSENGERKSELSTALRELLEAKIDDTPLPFVANNDTNNEDIVAENTNPPAVSNYIEPVSEPERSEEVVVVTEPPKIEEVPVVVPPPAPVQPEIRRLKDPRTAIPNEMRLTSPKTDLPAPVKRKLSISEYRKRKQQSETPADPEPSNDTTSSDKSPSRGRSDSASSGTSSLSSDEDTAKATHDAPSLTSLPLFTNSENEERKGNEEGTIGWSAAPTLVERQRENLTERLKREFGLFLSDDEEERARKQGLTAEAILKARQEALPAQALIAGGTAAFSPSQLPPQSYIPPPGTAPIHYAQFQAGTQVPGQYQTFPIAPPIAPPVFPVPASPAGSTAGKQAPQFLVPQAPPGANPYPPQFTTTTAVPAPVSRFSPTPSPSPGFNSSTPNQKPYYNHPHSTPRS